jgi:glycine/sarcosine N-methyltransferase
MSSFDDLALAYDNSIDWDARLNREIPFLLTHFVQGVSARILDIACGSGRHSIALAEKSHSVTGFDNSQSMINAAQELANEKGVSVDFLKADMLEFVEMVGTGFNLAICLGNSLALLPSFEQVAQVIEHVHTILDTEGIFIFQVLNFEEIIKTDFLVFPNKFGQTKNGQDVIFSRQFVLSDFKNKPQLKIASQVKNEDGWVTHVKHQSVLHLDHAWLTKIMTETGFSRIELFGDYSETPFVADSHRSLVVRVRK